MEPMRDGDHDRCTPCGECRVACAKTDEGLCWDCSQEAEKHMELGGEG